jgi:hypothetical protein
MNIRNAWKQYSSTIQALTFSAQQEVICIWEYVHTRCLNLRRNSSKFTRHNTSFSSTAAVVFASIWRAASFLCSSTSVSLLRLDIIDGLIWLFFVVCYLILHRFASLKFSHPQKYLKKPGLIPEYFWAHLELLWINKVHWQWAIRRLHTSPPSIMLTNEPRMVNKFWAHGPISFKHMSFWCLFFDLHLPIHHSNIGVQFR